MNYKKILSGVPDELKNLEDKGKVASYIPELKNVDPNKLGINLITVNNKNYSLGDSDENFLFKVFQKSSP